MNRNCPKLNNRHSRCLETQASNLGIKVEVRINKVTVCGIILQGLWTLKCRVMEGFSSVFAASLMVLKWFDCSDLNVSWLRTHCSFFCE